MNFEKIEALKDAVANLSANVAGVNAIGIGLVNETFKDENDLALYFYISDNQVIEKIKCFEIAVPIKYIVEPPPQLSILYFTEEDLVRELENADKGRYRPLLGGIQINLSDNKSSWAGTISTFVKSNDLSDDNLYLLSNKHVLEKKGLDVYQPLHSNKNLIGSVVFDTSFTNSDAALASVNSPSNVSINTIEGLGTIKEIRTIRYSDLGKRVVKRGRTTLVTEGTIESINVTVFIDGKPYCYDSVTIRADHGKFFSNAGDSGSPIIFEDDKKLMGLLFADNRTLGGKTFACTIDNVFRNLNIKLPD